MKLRFLVLIIFLVLVVHPALPQQAAAPLTKDQVMDLVMAGMETPKLAKLIQDHGINFDLTEDYLQALIKAGAQEPVIQALRAARPKPLSREQVLKLVVGGVPNARAAALVKQDGIDFLADEKFLQTVRLAGGEDSLIDSLREASAAAMGELIVTTSPNAEVYLDGDRQGRAGDQGEFAVKAKPGVHTLKVVLAGKKDFEQSVTLAPRESTKLEVRLEDNPTPEPAPAHSEAGAYLGVSIQGLDAALAKQFKTPDTVGALVVEAARGGPAEKAGIKTGDVIRALDGQPVQNPRQLTDAVAKLLPGTEGRLEILRDGELISIIVTFDKRPPNFSAHAPGSVLEGALRGVIVQDLTPALREQWGVPPNVKGVVITQIDAQSLCAQAGMQAGDVIEAINRQPVNDFDDFSRLAAEAKGQTLLRVSRQGRGEYVVLTPNDRRGDQKR